MAFHDWRVEIVSRETGAAVNHRPASSQERAAELEPEATDDIDGDRYCPRVAATWSPDTN
jgi:hypothetical protein